MLIKWFGENNENDFIVFLISLNNTAIYYIIIEKTLNGGCMKKSSKILLIIPAYNEEDNILKTYNKIKEYNRVNKTKYDVIVINDGSTDSTESILNDNNIPHIRLIHNLGIGGAVQTGYKYAYDNNYDIAVQFDGDGQHDINYVKDIIKPIIEEKCDFAIGSRYVDKTKSQFQSTRARQIGIRVISKVIKIVTGKRVLDTTSGFRACNKAVIEKFSNYYPLEYPEPITTTELLKSKYTLLEVPVSMNEREGGSSSIHSWKNVYYMINVCLSILMVKIRRYK